MRGLQLGKRKRGEKGEREEGKRIQKVVKSELTLPFKYTYMFMINHLFTDFGKFS